MIALKRISGHIVDVLQGRIYKGTIVVKGDKIASVHEDSTIEDTGYILPGLVDAHIHIESSLLIPAAFAHLAVRHGTVATVSDPHEIANVLGIAGVEYMIASGNQSPLKFHFAAPSCVPATTFESAGGALDADRIQVLLKRNEIKCLGEMMNFPGVIENNPGVMQKIALAHRYGKTVDGHAPGLTGEALQRYVGAGISTDHESISLTEAREKIALGMKILIREGSAARNFDALAALIDLYPEQCMFCSDDLHPDDLQHGHINLLLKRALDRGCDLMNALRCASVNPVLHYGLDVGLLRAGDDADFIVVDSLENFQVLKTVIRGATVMEDGRSTFPKVRPNVLNSFKTGPKNPSDFTVRRQGDRVRVIEAFNGQLVTGQTIESLPPGGDVVTADVRRDLLKIAVINRYRDTVPAVGFIRNFGLKQGAIASSVAHDSHNIVAVGVTDKELALAVNAVIREEGGLAVVSDGDEEILPLPVAGLMSVENGEVVAGAYEGLSRKTKALGSILDAPFMTLSFMSLLVIPSLKLSDLGLFDAESFQFVPLFV